MATDEAAIAAALEHPGTPLRRAVGSNEPFALEPTSLPKIADTPKTTPASTRPPPSKAKPRAEPEGRRPIAPGSMPPRRRSANHDKRMTPVDYVDGLEQGATYVTPSANAPAVGNDKSKPPYIVIIEDYEPLSRALCEMFRQRGNRCFAIRSKTSAEQFLRQVRPDLVVLDYQLIGGVGLEVAQIASENNVPVIITSGHHNIRERIGKFGYPYLVKPFALSELLSLASTVLGNDLGSPDNQPIQIH